MIVVTGATGNVGRNLVAGLAAEMSADLVGLIGRPATTFSAWAIQHAADFR